MYAQYLKVWSPGTPHSTLNCWRRYIDLRSCYFSRLLSGCLVIELRYCLILVLLLVFYFILKILVFLARLLPLHWSFRCIIIHNLLLATLMILCRDTYHLSNFRGRLQTYLWKSIVRVHAFCLSSNCPRTSIRHCKSESPCHSFICDALLTIQSIYLVVNLLSRARAIINILRIGYQESTCSQHAASSLFFPWIR